MLTIKEILFPVDFSERTCSAAPFVSALAEQFGARVTLLTVAPPLWYAAMGDVGTPVYIDPDELRADLQARLEGTLVKKLGRLPWNEWRRWAIRRKPSRVTRTRKASISS